MDRQKVLPKASAIDPQQKLASFLSRAKASDAEHLNAHLEAMLFRFCDAVAPAVLQAARLAGDGIKVGDLTFRRHDFTTPWIIGLEIQSPTQAPHVVTIALHKPSTIAEAVDFHERYIMRNGANAQAKQLSRDDLVERYRAAGYPETEPSAETVSDIEDMGAYRLGDAYGAPGAFDAAIADDGYWGGLLYKSHLTIESPVLDSPLGQNKADVRHPTGWVFVAEAIKQICDHFGLSTAVAERAASIGDRPQNHYRIDGVDCDLEEIGTAMALMDDCFPGSRGQVLRLIGDLEAQASVIKFRPRLPDLATLVAYCLEHGHDQPGRHWSFNDLNSRVYARAHGDITLVGLKATRDVLMVARGDLDRPSDLSIAICRFDDPGDAVQQLIDGRLDPELMIGRFDFSGSTPKVITPPAYNSHTIRASNLVAAVLESGAIEVAYEQQVSPAHR